MVEEPVPPTLSQIGLFQPNTLMQPSQDIQVDLVDSLMLRNIL